MHSKPLKKWSFTHDKLFHFSGKPQKFVLIKRRNFVLSFTYNWSSKLTNDIIRKIMTYSKFYLWTFGVHICGQEALLLFGVIPKTNCLLPVTSNWFGVLWFFRGNRADAVVVLVSFWKCDSHGLPLPSSIFYWPYFCEQQNRYFFYSKKQNLYGTWVACSNRHFSTFFRDIDKVWN